MNNINKLSFINELKDFFFEHDDWSIGMFIYSIFRPQGDKNKTGKISDLLHVSDEEVLNRIEKAKQTEYGI